jgi:glycosyltransferase involved in cell wall biosynthesis
MTVYNAEPYLKEAIDSIVAHTFKDWELIAVENGSSDKSPAILNSYSDERIRVFVLPQNIGRTPALRYAFEQAQGEYTAVLDADDVSYPERLMKQVLYLDQHNEVGIVGTWVNQINGRGEKIGKLEPPVDENELYEVLGWTNPIVHSSIMYRTEHAKRIGGYSATYTYAQDFALILAISRISRIGIIGEYLCKYRVITSSVTRNPKMLLNIGQEQLALLREVAQTIHLSERSAKRNHHRQAVAQLKIGVALVRERQVFTGLKFIAMAIIKEPKILIANGVVERIFSACGNSR